MTRSYKKTPIFGWTGHSEKQDKQSWHRRFRKWCKDKIRKHIDIHVKDIKTVSNPWAMSKDGKGYYHNYTQEDLRK